MSKQRLFGLYAFILVLFLIVATSFAIAEPEKSWTEPSLAYQQFSGVTVKNGDVAPIEYTTNQPTCSKYEVSVANKLNKLVTPWLFNVSTKKTLCMNAVDGGYAGEGYYLKSGTSIAGKLEGPVSSLYMIKDSPHILALESAGYASSMIRIIPDAYKNLRTSTNLQTGSITYTITSSPSDYIREDGANSQSSPIIIKNTTLKFSKNSEWAVADTAAGYFVRFNMTTGIAVVFGGKLNYNPGLNPFTQNAISNDGRYVAVASYQQTFFKVFDLSSCNVNPSTSPHNKECLSRDLKQFMNAKVTNFSGGAHNMSIVGNAVYFYAVYNVVNGVEKSIGRFATAPDAPDIKPITKIDYLALGDSFASGEGTFSYKSITNTDTNKCHTSPISYPYLITRSLSNVASVESVACSGAKMKDVMLKDLSEYNKNEPQAAGKETEEYDDSILKGYMPGYRAQLNFVEDKKPNIVTISMGGNDIGFSDIIKRCVLGADSCYHYYEDRAELVHSINAKYGELVGMYQQIKSYSNDGAKVYVVGYPKFADPDGSCAVNVRMNKEELQFGIDLVVYLNGVIQKAATQAGVAYINVEEAFAGNKLCQSRSEIAAMNGLILDKDMVWLGAALVPGPAGTLWRNGLQPPLTESYHPNTLGHELYRDAIIKQTNGFTLPMPESVVSNPASTPLGQIPFVHNAPKANREILPIKYEDSLTIDAVLANSEIPIRVSQDSSLKPNAVFSVYGYSEPTYLGDVTTDQNGVIGDEDDVVDLAGKLPPGYHTIHVRAVNVLGEPVELTKIIFVAASQEDINGDGIANADQQCLGLVEPANIDEDADDIDDACDGIMNDPQPDTTTQENEPTSTNDSANQSDTLQDAANPTAPQTENPPTNQEPAPNDDPSNIIVEPIESQKDLPMSESRPEWLLQKEAALAAQKAQIVAPQPPKPQPSVVTLAPQRVTATAITQPNPAPAATQQDSSTTQVAGVSSAIEAALPQVQPVKEARIYSMWHLASMALLITLISGFVVKRLKSKSA